MHSLHRVLFATFRIRTFGHTFMAETTRLTSQKRNLARIETFFGVRAVHAAEPGFTPAPAVAGRDLIYTQEIYLHSAAIFHLQTPWPRAKNQGELSETTNQSSLA